MLVGYTSIWGKARRSPACIISRGCSEEIGAPVGACWRGAAYAPERWETDETGAPHEME
jgi:hypothetical protein